MIERLSLRRNKLLIFLVTVLVLIASVGLGESGWTADIDIMPAIGLGAVLIGLLISRSVLPALIAHFFSIIIGLGWSFWVLSTTLPVYMTWDERWQDLTGRIASWYTLAIQNQTSYDNAMFILQMSLITWVVSYVATWFVFRTGRPWSAVVPSGVVLAINTFYAPNNITLWFVLYLLIASLLIIRYTLLEREVEWHVSQIYYRSDITFDFMRDGLIFSVIIISLAWFTPVMSQADTVRVFSVFDRQWRDVQGEWNRMFAGLNYRPDLRSSDSFSQALALGGPRTLDDTPVMFVDAPSPAYWRAVAFDEYDGNGWISNDAHAIDVAAFEPIPSTPSFYASQAFTQTYTMLNEGRVVLYSAGNPVWVSRDVRVKSNVVNPQSVSTVPFSYWDPRAQRPLIETATYLESDVRLNDQESYQILSHRPQITLEALQSDTGPYPQWILDRYLQLPGDTPQRVFDLAETITAQAQTPFDKAAAIENYLRREIAYNEQIAAPPADRNKVDYILFDLQEAYCDYYAPAMLAMLRHLGIPSRLAAGYATGSTEILEDGSQLYLVRNRDAHSWVEVFFPQYGWVEFEPTAAQAQLNRPSQTEPGDSFIPNEPNQPDGGLDETPPEEELEDPFARQDQEPVAATDDGLVRFTLPLFGEVAASPLTLSLGVGSLLALVLGVLGYQFYQNRHASRPRVLPAVPEVYFGLLRLARWLGVRKSDSQTPYEHAHALSLALPPAQNEVHLITDQYVHQTFSQQADITDSRLARVAEAWDKAKPIFYRAIFERFNPVRWLKNRR
jgi:transglutaminase-like putative cysteine protease